MEFKVRSFYEERYGKGSIPDDMTIQDWGISYDELEPYYDKFEYLAGVSGKAGNLRGEIQPGGNPFEAPRARDYPLPPLTALLANEMLRPPRRTTDTTRFSARAQMRHGPIPTPTVRASAHASIAA